MSRQKAAAKVAALVVFALVAAACVTGSPPTLEPASIPAATVGRYYEVAFTTSQGAGVHALDVPTGLQLRSGVGHALLFGVPTVDGAFTINMSASVGGPTMFQKPATTDRAYNLVIGPSTGDSGLIVDFLGSEFAAGQPLSVDLKERVHGGQAPYRFGVYCFNLGEICADPEPSDGPPNGMSLSTDGVLSGTIGPESGTNAYPNERQFSFVVCVVDSSSARACDTVDLLERRPPPTT